MTVESLRAREQAAWMPVRATISRVTRVSDGAGGTTETWGTHLTGVRCRVDLPSSGAEEQVAGQIQSVATVIVTVPHGTDVTARDRLTVDGRTFEVVAVLVGSYSTNRTLACEVAT